MPKVTKWLVTSCSRLISTGRINARPRQELVVVKASHAAQVWQHYEAFWDSDRRERVQVMEVLAISDQEAENFTNRYKGSLRYYTDAETALVFNEDRDAAMKCPDKPQRD